MDRLVSVDVKELELLFRPSHRSSATFTVTNLMHTMSVAISLATTLAADTTTNSSAHLFSFSPAPLSILPPLSSASFSLTLSPTPSVPTSPPDSVVLRSTTLPTGRASPDALRRLFSSPGRHVFRDASLPVSLVGPHVVRSLILRRCPQPSPPQATLETAFQLSKAISRCSASEISELLVDAARSGNPKFVAVILDAGADPGVRDSDGRSAVSDAVESGHVEVAKILLSAGAKPDGGLLIHAAAAATDDDGGFDLLVALADSCGDINSVNSSGRNAVHELALRGRVEAIRLLVARGADPSLADSAGWTPLHCAAAENHLAAAEFLLSAAPYTKYAVTRDGKTPFSLAADEGRAGVAELLDVLRLGDCLHRAASLGDANGIRGCLSQGAKVDGRDQNGWTALHRAAFKGRIEGVKTLIGGGAQIEALDDAGHTPLHCALEAGHANVALYLIAQGARANPKSIKGLCNLNLSLVRMRGEEEGAVKL